MDITLDLNSKKLIWKDEYNVDVKEIDEQHKKIFAAINDLIEIASLTPTKEKLMPIIEKLAEYKELHFATEEKYFHQFNFEGASEHEAEHRRFNETFIAIQSKYQENTTEFAFALLDFLEDWLIEHLIIMDQKYKKCFKEHGLT